MDDISHNLTWLRETVPYWNSDKARILRGAPQETLPNSLRDPEEGAVLPDEWWRVEEEGRTVGFGRIDVNWGDAEILLAVDPQAQGRGVGSFILTQLEREARERGLNYLYNRVEPDHPAHADITEWLEKRDFSMREDSSGGPRGALARAVPARQIRAS